MKLHNEFKPIYLIFSRNTDTFKVKKNIWICLFHLLGEGGVYWKFVNLGLNASHVCSLVFSEPLYTYFYKFSSFHLGLNDSLQGHVCSMVFFQPLSPCNDTDPSGNKFHDHEELLTKDWSWFQWTPCLHCNIKLSQSYCYDCRM